MDGIGVLAVIGVVVGVGGAVGVASFGKKSHFGISTKTTSSMATNPNSLSPLKA